MDLNTLNKEQKIAVEHKNGPLLVLSGAGTGKTRVLTSRFVYIVKNLDVDFNLDDFDLSFLSSFGKNKVNRIHGIVSGNLNLWGSLSDIKLKGETMINDGNLYLPITNTEYKIVTILSIP